VSGGAWRAAKAEHREKLGPTGFAPSLDFLNELMFEPAEYAFLQSMGAELAGRLLPGAQPGEAAVPFLDNPGSAYERGVVHGRTFRETIEWGIDRFCRKLLDEPSPDSVTVSGRMFDYVESRFPEVLAELRGIAAGAGRTFEEIWALNTFNAVGRVRLQDACSTVILRDRDGGTHLGKTSDIDADQRRMMLLRRVRDADHDVLVLGWAGTVWVEAGLNADGLAVGLNSGPAQQGQTGAGVPQHFGPYPVLFRAGDVREAVEAFRSLDFAGKGLVIGVTDAQGRGAVIEKSGPGQGVRAMEGHALLGVNDFLTEEMSACNANARPAALQNCAARRERWERFLQEDDPSAGPKAIERLLADDASPGALCQTGQAGLHTEAAAIISPADRVMKVTGAPPSRRLYLTHRLGGAGVRE